MESSLSVKIGKTRTRMRTCKKCGETKELTDFVSNKSCRGGRTHTCHKCSYQLLKSRPAAAQEQHRKTQRRSYLKRKYGVTMEWYEDKLKEQKGLCAICSCDSSELRSRDAMFCVDHCHTTGQPRALLCHKCNAGIGMLKDNPILVARAWTYLQQHQH